VGGGHLIDAAAAHIRSASSSKWRWRHCVQRAVHHTRVAAAAAAAWWLPPAIGGVADHEECPAHHPLREPCGHVHRVLQQVVRELEGDLRAAAAVGHGSGGGGRTGSGGAVGGSTACTTQGTVPAAIRPAPRRWPRSRVHSRTPCCLLRPWRRPRKHCRHPCCAKTSQAPGLPTFFRWKLAPILHLADSSRQRGRVCESACYSKN
jgi:hypothetical protein